MGRRKQDKPTAFKAPPASAPTPSEAEAVARQPSGPDSISVLPEKKGLVAAIWEAACRDQAYYEEQQLHRKKEADRGKRKRGGGRKRSGEEEFEAPAVWFEVEGCSEEGAQGGRGKRGRRGRRGERDEGGELAEGVEGGVTVFASVRAVHVADGGEAATTGTTTAAGSGPKQGRRRKAKVCTNGAAATPPKLMCSVVGDAEGRAVLVRHAAGTRVLELGAELVEDVVRLLRSKVLAVHVGAGMEDDRVGLGVTDVAFTMDVPEAARQCLKRVVLSLAQETDGDCQLDHDDDHSHDHDHRHNLPQIVSMDEDDDTELDASRLYELIKPTGEEPGYEDVVALQPMLRPTLHGYQQRVLRWMVERETVAHFFDGEVVGYWRRVAVLESADGNPSGAFFYVHQGTGELVREAGYASRVALLAPKGGIACDEMGLGKTVEVLALIAANPFAGGADCQGAAGFKEEEEEHDGKEEEAAAPADAATDATGRRKLACVCGDEGRLKDDLPSGLLLIQCEVCGIFQHMHCLGLTSFNRPDEWKCTGCCAAEVLEMDLVESRATLIVCPMPILSQWQSEIDKHVVPGSLKVVTYLGQEHSLSFLGTAEASKAYKASTSSRSNALVRPQDLASADVVLTTYDTLRKDLHRNPDKEVVRSLRHTKRYHAVPTPLTSIKFWRIVVDEAQMVESSTAKATEMVRKIAAVNRWAVTGTPISRGLEDLHGLFDFLGIEHIAWYATVQRPIESGAYDEYERALTRLIKLLKPGLGGIMWRSSKKDVAHELRLPAQTACHNKLRFSNIEKHFYDRQHQTCCTEANKALKSNTTGAVTDPNSSRPLTKREERKLLLPLLRLRQACVHPPVGAGGLKSLSDVKTPMSMIQVLNVMVGKAKVEAEDAQRLVLSTINGLAGLEILRDQFVEAASLYRSVLKISKDNKEYIRMDKLQTLHTVYNLTQILDQPGVGRCLDDDELASSIEPLERQYLSESTMRLEIAESELVEVQKQADGVLEEFVKGTGSDKAVVDGWWVNAIQLITSQHAQGADVGGVDFVARIKKDLNEDQGYRRGREANVANIADKFSNLAGLQGTIDLKLQGMDQSRTTVMSLLRHLGERVARREAALVDTAAHCGSCRSFHATSGIVCEHCHFNKDMMTWEMSLFSTSATKFVTDYRGGEEENAELKEVNERLRKNWEELSDGEKEQYNEMEKEDTLRYEREMAAAPAAAVGAEGVKSKKGSKAQGPKKPTRAFAFYQKEKRPEVKKLVQKERKEREEREAVEAAARERERAEGGLAPLDAEEIAEHAHRRAMHRVGMGGLDEDATGLEIGVGSVLEGAGRRSGRTGENKLANAAVVRRPSQTEQVLRMILSALKRVDFGGRNTRGSSRGGDAKAAFMEEKKFLIDAAECHLGIMELRRKEYLKVGSVAMSQRGVLYALDELNMSRMRIKLRSEGQELTAEEERYIVPEEEVPLKIEDLENELIVAQADLSKALGTLKYLVFLERLNQPNQTNNSAAAATAEATDVSKPMVIEPCPVCHDEIDNELAMLPCGHILCVKCNLKIVEKENPNRSGKRDQKMRCPTCRAETPASETAMVVTNPEVEQSDPVDADVEHDPELWSGEEAQVVLGGYGTKIEAVVRRIKTIMTKLPDDKILVFSLWQDALDIVSHALATNDIAMLFPKTRKAFDESLSKFRGPAEKAPRVLLLLLKQGGNGLNLQQAQHVMFLEPVLDAGEEAQAVGRVDRMGQTRSTFVHRFSFRDSVEENVMRMSAAKKRAHEGKSRKGQKKKALTVAEVNELLR